MRALVLLLAAGALALPAQQTITVRPKEIDDVLLNPGIGLITSRFKMGGPRDAPVSADPQSRTSLEFLIVYWRALEPEQGKYRWELIDSVLKTAHERGKTVLMRIEPYGAPGGTDDVPAWYRAMVGSEPNKRDIKKWLTDPEDPRYALHFGNCIRAAGSRYDGHPDLESVDLAIVGSWGEGEGSGLLTRKSREALVDSYVESFRKTSLVALITDEKTNKYILSKRAAGWRADCLGDMGGFSPTFSHMQDIYPQWISNYGVAEAWRKAPVTFEACWVMQTWKDHGWDLDYIIDQSLKWHISSFNAKTSPIPEEWWPTVNRWLKSMGYRLALRKFTYPRVAAPNGALAFTSWWENKGVAPCYKAFPLALRLRNEARTEVFTTGADVREWLPGDSLYDGAVFLPAGMPAGEYELELALLDPDSRQPAIQLANSGRTADGWYSLGRLVVQAAR